MGASHCRRYGLLAGLLASCAGGAVSESSVPPSDVSSSPATAAITTPPATDASPASTSVFDAPPVGPPDCTGGTAILETTVLESALVIRESTDGHFYCIEDAMYTGTIGSIPERASETVMMTGSGQYGRGYYQFGIPADFPSIVTVFDENGDELPVGRGRAGHYLVVIDPLVGQQSATGGPPPLVDRTLEVRDNTGAVVTRLTFPGFGASEFASYEQFAACVRDAGVDMRPPTTPGETVPPRDPTPRDALQTAWVACADLMFSYMTASQQGGPEYLESFRFEMDCLANAGFYPMLNEPNLDQAGFELTLAQCRSLGPGRTAVVECLRSNGLEVVVDGVQSVGPYEPEAADRAWQACRDTFAIWEVSSPVAVADRIPRMDCMAAKGWLTAFLQPADAANARLQADGQQC